MLNFGCTGDLVDLSALFAASFISALQEVIVAQPQVNEVFWLHGMAQDFFLDGGEIAADGCCFYSGAERKASADTEYVAYLPFWKVTFATVSWKLHAESCKGGGVVVVLLLLVGPSGPVPCEGEQTNCFQALTDDPRPVAGLQPLLSSF